MNDEIMMTESERITCKVLVDRVEKIKGDLKLTLHNLDELADRYGWDNAYIVDAWRVYAELIEFAFEVKNELKKEAAK